MSATMKRGVAGQISAEMDGLTLVGSIYGGPVVAVWGTESNQQVFVDSVVTERIGFPFHTDPIKYIKRYLHQTEGV